MQEASLKFEHHNLSEFHALCEEDSLSHSSLPKSFCTAALQFLNATCPCMYKLELFVLGQLLIRTAGTLPSCNGQLLNLAKWHRSCMSYVTELVASIAKNAKCEFFSNYKKKFQIEITATN